MHQQVLTIDLGAVPDNADYLGQPKKKIKNPAHPKTRGARGWSVQRTTSFRRRANIPGTGIFPRHRSWSSISSRHQTASLF